jgi:hypothetical protein
VQGARPLVGDGHASRHERLSEQLPAEETVEPRGLGAGPEPGGPQRFEREGGEQPVERPEDRPAQVEVDAHAVITSSAHGLDQIFNGWHRPAAQTRLHGP